LAKNLKAEDRPITTQERSEGRAPCVGHRRCSRARGWLGICPARAVFINQSGSLGPIHGLEPCSRRLPIGHSPARGMRRAAIQVPHGRALSANGHADRDFECVPVWRFGNSQARPERGTDRSPVATSDSATIYFLGALGRRRCRKRTPGPPPFSSMNSTPAASKARRTAKSLATVREVLSSASSARLIVLSPSDDARARSFALHLRRARAARI
jgi:hypothetical protein